MSCIFKPVFTECLVCAWDDLPPSPQGEFFQKEVKRKFTFSDSNHQGLADGSHLSGPLLSPGRRLSLQCIYWAPASTGSWPIPAGDPGRTPCPLQLSEYWGRLRHAQLTQGRMNREMPQRQHLSWAFAKPFPTLCNPMECSLPGSSVHGTSQARILEWVATSFSRGSSRLRVRSGVSYFAGRFFSIWATREATGNRQTLDQAQLVGGT